MQFIIYSYGSGEALASVFNAIVLVLHGDNNTLLHAFINVGSMTGLSLVLMSVFQTQSLSILIKQWFLPTFLIVGGMFVPTATVNIKDVVIRSYHTQVDNVPFGLAFVACSLSQLSHALTEIMETNFASPDDLSYHKSGSMFASNLILEAQNLRISDEDFASNMREFVGQCVIPEAMMGRKYSAQDLRTSDDIWGLIKDNASSVRAMAYKEYQKRSEIISCKEAAIKMDTTLKKEVESGFTFLQNKFFGGNAKQKLMINTQIKSLLPSAVATLTQMSEASADFLLRQMLMVPTLVESAESVSVGMGNAPKFAARRAYLQQRTTWQTYGEMAKSMYPMLKAVMEAILYALFIFLIPISLVQLGFKAIGQWVKLVTWIHLWPPLYAVINSLSTYMAIRDSSLLAHNMGLTIASSLGIMDANADWVATCGYISLVGIPSLAWALVSGAQMAVTQIAGALTGSTQSLATSAAGEVVSGNFSYGNVQAYNTNTRNWSQDQTNLSPTFNSGSFRSSDGHVDQTLSSDGTTIGHVARSNLPTSVNVAAMASRNLSDQYSDALNVAEGKSQASTQSEVAGFKSAFDKGFQENESMSFSDGVSSAQTAAHQSSSSILAHHAEKFAKDNNLQTTDSSTIMAGISAGLSTEKIMKLANFGGKLDGNTQTQANLSTSIQKARDYMDQHQVQETMSHAVQEAKDQRFTTSDDQSSRYNESIASSFDKADQLRREASSSFSRAQNLSHQLSYVQANSSTINRDASQDVVEYVSNQSRGGKGAMGMNEALRMAAQDPQMFQAYAQEWVKEHGIPSSIPNTPSNHSFSMEGMNQGVAATPFDMSSQEHFMETYEHTKPPSTVHDSFQGYQDDVQRTSKRDFDLSDQNLKAVTSESLDRARQTINKDRHAIESQKQPIAQEHLLQSERSTTMRAGEQAWENTKEDAGEIWEKTKRGTAIVGTAVSDAARSVYSSVTDNIAKPAGETFNHIDDLYDPFEGKEMELKIKNSGTQAQ